MNKLELFKNVGEEITIDLVRNFLNSSKGQDVQFDISTLGGDLATAITIHDLIKAYPNKTVANIIGLTASAGTVIAIACDDVVMSDNSLFLIHNGWKEVTGNVYDFQKAAVDMQKTDAIMVKMYREKTGISEIKIHDLMKASDWMSPTEALNYGFIDRVSSSGIKIAASAMVSSAKGKINALLLTKLEEKMKNPFKKETKAKADVMNILALKDGNFLINAEAAAVGVEVAPLGAMSLEDGEYELADGRKIIVSGGVITEVVDLSAEPEPVESAAIVDTVAEMLVQSEAKTMAKIEAMLKPLQAMVSTHTPAKAAGVVGTPAASYSNRDAMMAKIEAKTAELKLAKEAKRKGI